MAELRLDKVILQEPFRKGDSQGRRSGGWSWSGPGGYWLSERRACGTFGVARSSIRDRSVRPRQEALRRRIWDLAGVRVRSGHGQLHVLLRREGWPAGHKRSYRLYREED